jgi:EmrB/QacA subfamily drug resistance transporter
LGFSKRRKALIVVATLIGTFLAALDATVVGTAMPTVIGELGGLRLYPWVFASYLLSATVTVPVFGKLSDTYGRKPIYLTGVALFLLGSVLCGTAQTMEGLILYRTIQGLGAGAVQPVAITIMGDIFELETRARIQGAFGAVWGISAVIGPALGGFITDFISWRWCFYINLPFGIAAALLLYFVFSERVERRSRRVDYAGVGLLTGSLVALLLAILEGGRGIPGNPAALLFAGGLTGLALFLVVERRAAEPIVPPDMFGDRIIAVAALGNVLMGGVLLGVSVYVPLFVQGALGGTAVTAGAVVASLSIGWPVGSFVSGRLMLRVGYRTTLLAGTLFMTAGGLLTTFFGPATALWYAVLAVVLVGLGLGFVSTSYVVSVQNAVSWARRGVATSSVMFFRTVGGALGVAVMGAVLNAALRERYSATVDRIAGGDRDFVRLLQDPNALLQPAVRDRIPGESYAELAAALADALSPVFWIVLALAAAGVLVALFFPGGRAKDLMHRGD